MSIRIYRLLRNNKEEGPFTSEELVQKNLRPYDLIWVDGRSVAWSYPCELPEFKRFAPLPGENKQQSAAVSPSVQAAIAVNDNIPKAPQQKPRYKVSAAWNRIQTYTAPVFGNSKATDEKKISSKKNMVAARARELPSKSLSWEEAWLDWEKEKKGVPPVTEPLKNKPAAQQSKKKEHKDPNPVLETKYSQSLDDLKDQYIENILKEKQAKKSGNKAAGVIIPAMALLIIFGSAYWLLSGDEETAAALNKTVLKKDQPATPVQNTSPVSGPASDSINTASQTMPREKESSVRSEPAVIEQAEERKSFQHASKPVALKQPSVKQTKKIAEKQFVAPAAEPTPVKTTKEIVSMPKTSNKDTREKEDNLKNAGSTPVIANSNVITSKPAPTNKDNITTKGNINDDIDKVVVPSTSIDDAPAVSKSDIGTTEKPNIKKTSADYVTTPGYIKMVNGTANLKIENISDVDLDLVVVDVQYFDASNRFRKGETLYLHNLRAGKNVMVKTPKDTNSLYATSKVSLISSDKKQLYVVGDN